MIRKKLLSMILVICMVMSLTPAIAFADGDTPPVQIEVKNAQSGSTQYKLNGGEWMDLNESRVYDINDITADDQISIRAVPNQDQALDMTGTGFYVNGHQEQMDFDALQTETGWSFTYTEGSVYQVCVEYRSGGDNPGPEPGDEPAHGGYEGEEKTAFITVTGKADFYINDSRMVNGNDGDSFDDVKYHYDGRGNVDFYFYCFIGERLTGLKVNNVDYFDQIPTPDTPEGREALLAACKGQLYEFKITVPYSENGYAIESNVKWLGDDDKDYMVVGNFLWTYTDKNQGDDYIDHGRMELLGVNYNGVDYSPDDLNNPGTAFEWGQDENGGSATLPVGAVVTVKLVPDYGYQLTSFGINGGTFGTGDEQSTFTFEIRPGNAHLGAHFTPVEDKVTSDADIVSEGNIRLGENEIDTGSVVLSVGNAPETVDERAFQAAVEANEGTEHYEIASVLDINLNQVIYKGTEDDVWSNEMTELQSPAEISLQLNENYDDAVVVHEKHDGSYEVIDTTYNAEDGTVTFETDSFSNYAVAAAPGALLEKSFTVGFDPCGIDEETEGKVEVKIGDGEAEFVQPWVEYAYDHSQTPITFTVTPPQEADGRVPLVYVVDATFTNYAASPVLSQESDGKYSFRITPGALWEDDLEPNFVVFVCWSDFDTFGPGEGQFMVETHVPGGDANGTILIQPGSGNHKSFGSKDKYIYNRSDDENKLYVTFIPEPGMELVSFRIGDDMYGYVSFGSPSEREHPLPERTVDGQCRMTISIPALSDTNAEDWIYVEAMFEAADPVAVPDGLTWDGKIAKWNAVEGADHYRVTLMKGYSNGNEIGWAGMVNSGIITDTCEYDFSNRIDSDDDSVKYRFYVCAIKNKVCSDEAKSNLYGSTDVHTYMIIEGANGSWMQNSDGTLTVRANGEFGKFTGVKVDNVLIDAKNYTAISGSTIVTLKNDYLKTLSAGKHKLTVLYTDGECSTDFEIKKTATEQTKPDESDKNNTTTPETGGNKTDTTGTQTGGNKTNTTTPQTGDNRNLTLWFTILVVSGAGVFMTTVYNKRKRKLRKSAK